MTAPFMSMTWHLALMRNPPRVSWITGVAHAAWNGGLAILLGSWLSEVVVSPGIDKRVVARHRRFERRRWHGDALILHHDLSGQVGDRVRREKEPSGEIDVWRCGCPVFTRYGVGIEDGPDGAAAVVAIADAGHGGVDEVVRVVLTFLALR